MLYVRSHGMGSNSGPKGMRTPQEEYVNRIAVWEIDAPFKVDVKACCFHLSCPAYRHICKYCKELARSYKLWLLDTWCAWLRLVHCIVRATDVCRDVVVMWWRVSVCPRLLMRGIYYAGSHCAGWIESRHGWNQVYVYLYRNGSSMHKLDLACPA